MSNEFKGKTVIVTGAGNGIGRAIAIAFANEGTNVVVSDISKEGGEETVEIIKKKNEEAIFIKADVGNGSEIKELVKKTVSTFGRLDYAVNNAGIEGEVAPIADYSEEIWDRVIRINLKGVWLGLKYQIPAILETGGGAIVNIASMEGIIAFPYVSPYVAAKHGVNGITKAAALEYMKAGVRVNSVCPGPIDTKMLGRLTEEVPQIDDLVNMSPAGRKGRPEEIAQAAIWLCSTKASFVNGHTLVVDGGYVIQ
jgi:NAD(P)-dependent dehydrogenase (short-subunit alcohol dehydrogenase family)